VRRILVVILAMVALGALPLGVSACGGDRAVAQASPADANMQSGRQPWLVSVHDVALVTDRPASFYFHTTSSHQLTIIIAAARPLASSTLRRIALGVGMREEVALTGSPHTMNGQQVYALKAAPIRAGGYYRLSLAGRGRLLSLVVRDW